MKRTAPAMLLVLALFALFALFAPWPASAAGPGEAPVLLTPAIEEAIDRALERLARQQKPEGRWGERHAIAQTALTLLAFQVRGHFPGSGEYGPKLGHGLDYLLEQSRSSGGYMGTNMYEHAYATLALAESWGMSDHRGVREALKGAVRVILGAQSSRGGWRYHPRPSGSDISVTVTQLVALAAAREAGIFVPEETLERAVAYVRSVQERTTGGFGYGGPFNPTFSTTGCGLASLMYAGEHESAAARQGLAFLMGRGQNIFDPGAGTRFYTYGHYYCTLATSQAGEPYASHWYTRLSEELLRSQRSEGGWGGGYRTPMTVLTLGTATRFLPIHQR